MIRNPWKGVFLLLAIWALAIADHGSAQQSNFPQEINGSPDGLYSVPDAESNVGTARDSTSSRTAQSYLSSLDPQGEQLTRDMEKAALVAKQAADAKKLHRYLISGGDTKSSSWKPNLSERAWIAILVGVGLLVSLAAGGCVWWSSSQHSKAKRSVLIAMTREPAGKPDATGKQDKPSKRRAA